ncbi:hypothetical protein [Shouchella clausii]|uniref:hypothetical protein n=1 Tax=Shouchella TaxID=2893057 RepID=UPI000798AFAC|nr:hypothetical protein [Shouchella clausii]KKI87992.1 hypothetical protein WZ76_03300 [Shouchella clausii]PAD19577.1 hypothetical protein CHH73_00420 [Shouchella clausii]
MRKITNIVGMTIGLFISYHSSEYILYLQGKRDSFEIEPLIAISALPVALLVTFFRSFPSEVGKPREWDREDWVDPLADEDEKTK